jgi:uncharacterized protein (TIGR00255 family)
LGNELAPKTEILEQSQLEEKKRRKSMKSMTGYAYREEVDENISVSVEIKSYNNRFLDLSVYLPQWLPALEPKIREFMASRCSRGKVEVIIRLKERDAGISVTINKAAAKAYISAINELAHEFDLSEKPSLSLLLGFEGVLETDKNRDDERYQSVIWPVLTGAVDEFDAGRSREGKHTEEDILSHIAVLESAVKTVAGMAPQLELSIKETLRSRFEELLGDKVDENRILAETAVFLMKYTISEEISRLFSHLQEFRLETGRNPSPGKKLDFLCQEINREINTIGSKTPLIEVSRAVVDMKNALENIREQLRNVE